MINHTITAHPLCWPINKPRTKIQVSGSLRTSFVTARNEIVHEVRKLGGTSLVISTNITLRRDGLPYAAIRQPDDTGVAVYFNYKNKQMCFACDRWIKVESNIQAIAKTISALRGIARWGTGDMMEAAFTGFSALPSPNQSKNWREILGNAKTLDEAEYSYRLQRSIHHPDKGGNAQTFHEIRKAWEEAKAEFNAGIKTA
jgi:hypothetical protein